MGLTDLPPNRGEHAAERIRLRIIEQSLKPGEVVGTEEKLAGEFGMSRSAIRDAIGRLRGLGLVDDELAVHDNCTGRTHARQAHWRHHAFGRQHPPVASGAANPAASIARITRDGAPIDRWGGFPAPKACSRIVRNSTLGNRR